MTTKRYPQTIVLNHEVIEFQDCKHHWLIESPHGPISKGVCRLCGDEKGFRNSLEIPPIEDNKDSTKSEGSAKNNNLTVPLNKKLIAYK